MAASHGGDGLFFRLSDLELEIIVIDIFKHLRMRQCRGIPQAFEVVAGGNLAQDAAHRLAGKCFRQFGDKLDLFRAGQGSDLAAHPGAQFLAQGFRPLHFLFHRDVGIDGR